MHNYLFVILCLLLVYMYYIIQLGDYFHFQYFLIGYVLFHGRPRAGFEPPTSWLRAESLTTMPVRLDVMLYL